MFLKEVKPINMKNLMMAAATRQENIKKIMRMEIVREEALMKITIKI